MQYEGMTQPQHFSRFKSSSSVDSVSSSGSAKIIHPLGSQLLFSTSLATLDIKVTHSTHTAVMYTYEWEWCEKGVRRAGVYSSGSCNTLQNL